MFLPNEKKKKILLNQLITNNSSGTLWAKAYKSEKSYLKQHFINWTIITRTLTIIQDPQWHTRINFLQVASCYSLFIEKIVDKMCCDWVRHTHWVVFKLPNLYWQIVFSGIPEGTLQFGLLEKATNLLHFASIQSCNSKFWAISVFKMLAKLVGPVKYWPWQIS